MRCLRMEIFFAAILVAGSLSGCSQQKVMFRPEPVVREVNDRSPIEPPEERDYNRYAYTINTYVNGQLDDLIDPVDPPPAMNVNSLDEVPNSSWFTNRLGSLPMTRQEVALGTGSEDGSPQLRFPWMVSEIGMSGGSRYLMITDGDGRDFTLKFDSRDAYEAGTAAEVIASRLAYAAGYNVQESYIVYFMKQDISIDTISEPRYGAPTEEELDEFLSTLIQTEDDRFRAVAIRDPDGRSCGYFPMTGTRSDDPNDLIPHQHRRELRSLKLFYAWLGHVDITPDNGLDVLVEDESGSYLRHYLTGFDDCFGVYFLDNLNTHPGFEHRMLDMEAIGRGAILLGSGIREWEKIERPNFSFAGHYYGSDRFDVEKWKPIHPVPYFSQMTPRDAFWMAKVIADFGDDHISGALEQSMLLPVSKNYILDVLKARRKLILDWAYSQVSPLDDFSLTLKMQGLVFDFVNLAEKYVLVRGDDLEYQIRIMDRERNTIAELNKKSMHEYVIPDRAVSFSGEDNYVIFEVITVNSATDKILPAVRAHFFGGKETGFTLIGIERDW